MARFFLSGRDVRVGSFKGVKSRMAKAGGCGGQESVGVIMLTLGEVVVQGRTQKHQDDCGGQGDRQALPDEVLENGLRNGKCHP